MKTRNTLAAGVDRPSPSVANLPDSTDHTRIAWRAVLSALCATLVGLGLGRFAYTPLLPAIIEAKWFGASASAYLGAANLAGYVLGALIAAPLAARFTPRHIMRAMMSTTAIAMFACAWPVDFYWFFGWRFVSGVTGATLIVLAAPTVLANVGAARRGLASGVIFMGVGLGIAASGTLVPLLLGLGLTQAWLGLSALSMALTAAAWGGWPVAASARPLVPASAATFASTPAVDASDVRPLRFLYAEYALNAAGLVPHMIFLVVYIANGLGWGQTTGAWFWVAFGLGAIAGPVVNGYVADRIGFRLALRLGFALQAAAVLLPAVTSSVQLLVVSSVVMGAFTPGIVPLVLGRIRDLVAHDPAVQKSAWSHATTAFALLQALSAYGMSWLLDMNHHDYAMIFEAGAACLLLALCIDLVAFRKRSASPRG